MLMALVLVVTLATGCGGSENKQPVNEGGAKVLRHNHGEEPESIDPALSTTVDGGSIVIACFDSLYSSCRSG